MKQKRDELNAKVKQLIGSVKEDTTKLKDLNTKIKDLKDKRDIENKEIQGLKAKRDELNKKIGGLVEDLKKIQKIKPSANEPKGNLGSEIKRLEWKLQTEALSVKKYDELHDKLESMQEQQEKQKEAKDSGSKFKEITRELDILRKEARKLHQEVLNKSDNAKKHHEEMISMFPTVKELRKSVNPVAKEIQTVKKEAEEYHNKLVAEFGEMKKDEKKIVQRETRKNEENTAKQMQIEAERLFKEFQAGKKLSSEELMIIKQYGRELF